MTARPVTVRAGESVRVARERLEADKFSRLPVVDDGGQVVGMVTRAALSDPAWPPDATVDGVMATPVVSVASSDPLELAARLVNQRGVGGLPVIDDGRLVGVITVSDIIDGLLEALGVFDDRSCRIDLTASSGSGDLADAARVLCDEGAEVLGVSRLEEAAHRGAVLCVRARCAEIGRATLALARRGFRVLAIHTGQAAHVAP